jgi:hypothetical protein
MALPATTQTVFTGPTPNRQSSAGAFAGALAGGLLQGKAAELERKRALAAEQRKTQGVLLGALINKGELRLKGPGDKGGFKFAGVDLVSTSTGRGGFQIRTAEDFKNYTQGLKNAAETKFKAASAMAGIMSKVAEAAFFSDDPSSAQEFITTNIENISTLIDQGNMDQLAAEYPSIPPELFFQEAAARSGQLPQSSKEELGAAFDQSFNAGASGLTQDPANFDPSIAQRRQAGDLSAGTALDEGGVGAGDLARIAASGALLAKPTFTALKTIGPKVLPALGAVAKGVGKAFPIGKAALAGGLVGEQIGKIPAVADPLQRAFQNMILQRQLDQGVFDDAIRMGHGPVAITPEIQQQQRTSQFGGR